MRNAAATKAGRIGEEGVLSTVQSGVPCLASSPD